MDDPGNWVTRVKLVYSPPAQAMIRTTGSDRDRATESTGLGVGEIKQDAIPTPTPEKPLGPGPDILSEKDHKGNSSSRCPGHVKSRSNILLLETKVNYSVGSLSFECATQMLLLVKHN